MNDVPPKPGVPFPVLERGLLLSESRSMGPRDPLDADDKHNAGSCCTSTRGSACRLQVHDQKLGLVPDLSAGPRCALGRRHRHDDRDPSLQIGDGYRALFFPFFSLPFFFFAVGPEWKPRDSCLAALRHGTAPCSSARRRRSVFCTRPGSRMSHFRLLMLAPHLPDRGVRKRARAGWEVARFLKAEDGRCVLRRLSSQHGGVAARDVRTCLSRAGGGGRSIVFAVCWGPRGLTE